MPEPWLLGSSPQSAVWAAQLALPYAFADFINPSGAAHAALYRQTYLQQQDDLRPRTAVAAWVVCAESDDEAHRLAASSRMTLQLLRQGQLIPVPPPEKALEFLRTEGVPTGAGLPRRRGIIGSPQTVRAGVEALAEEYGAEEVIVVTITYDHHARRRSYELLAEAFDLEPRPR